MPGRLGVLLIVLGVGSGGCGDKAPPATKLEVKGEEKAEEKAPVPPKAPENPRISRPGEFFRLTLRGPAFDGPLAFEFDPDSVRINVISTRSAIQYVRQNNTPTKASDGSQIVVSQVQWAGAAAGEFERDAKRTFVITLGVENPTGQSTTLQLESGKLTADHVSLRPRELRGKFEGKLHATNKGRESEVYEISGAFDLTE